MNKEEKLLLPDEVTPVTGKEDPRDLVIIGMPKIGKGTILGDFTTKYNALVFGLEKGGYEYIPAKKIEIFTDQSVNNWEAYQNYVKYRNLLLENKGKYDYLIIDGLSDLDYFSEIGGTLAYMNTIIGKKFNRSEAGTKYIPTDVEFKSVLTLPDGAGYAHTRKWFLDQIEIFRQISPYRIYAAHVVDKFIKDNGKEEVVGAEIALTGQLKRIFASKVTALAKLSADGNDRYLSFDVLNESIVAGSRAPQLHGKMLISTMQEDGKVKTFWEQIYKNHENK